MYPKKVFHCACLAFEITLCLINGDYSLKDIVSKLNEEVNTHRKIYCSKCGNNEVIFSCRKHMSLVTDCEIKNKRCIKCIKTYLQTSYHCCYEYTNFDLPLLVKKEKKILCLIVEKL